ncbi:MAG TPA: ATPase, partial [Candidatus Dormibacteraeota bacterium]
RLVPEHFGMRSPTAVMEAVYTGRLDDGRLTELAPVVFVAAGRDDRVARGLIDDVADEVIATAVAAIRRLHLTTREVEVILGGGVIRSNDKVMLDRISVGIAKAAPRALIRKLAAPPVLGAALIGLDETRSTAAVRSRLRRALTDRRLQRRGQQDGAAAVARRRQPS